MNRATKERWASMYEMDEEEEEKRREQQHRAKQDAARREEKRRLKREKQRREAGAAPSSGKPSQPPPSGNPKADKTRLLNLQRLELTAEQDNPTAIRSAYRRLALKCHPDKNPAPEAAELFKQLHAAYEALLADK